jgi:hypothetical protein
MTNFSPGQPIAPHRKKSNASEVYFPLELPIIPSLSPQKRESEKIFPQPGLIPGKVEKIGFGGACNEQKEVRQRLRG